MNRNLKLFSLFRRCGRSWKRISDMGLPMDVAERVWAGQTVARTVAIRPTGVKYQRVRQVSGRIAHVRVPA